MSASQDICASRIRQARALRDVTQDELAKMIGRHFRTLSEWERGQSSPPLKDLRLIADLLKVRLSWLVGDGEVMEVKP